MTTLSLDTVFQRLRQTDVYRSIVRHGAASTNRNRSLVVFENLFLHLHPVKVREKTLRFAHTYWLGAIAVACAVILTATGASFVGRSLGYVIGRGFGHWVLIRYGGYVWITESRIKLGQYLFLRHGGKIVIVAQFVPVLRTLAGILAGANRMPQPLFLAANIFGAFIWAVFFGTAAYMLGRQFEKLAGSAVVVLGLAAVAVILIGAHFVRGHEAQLAAKAEQALPGPLQLP